MGPLGHGGRRACAGGRLLRSQIGTRQLRNDQPRVGRAEPAQLVEIENLKVHSRQTEDQLIRAEQELAARDQADPNSPRLAGDAARAGLPNGRRLPAAVSQQLLGWARQYPNLSFDAETGVSKCDMDVLFDSGQAELKPAARTMLTELAQVLQLAEAKDLKIMVVGHTDNQRIVGQAAREKYANNFHLSTARALAVADVLRSQGLSGPADRGGRVRGPRAGGRQRFGRPAAEESAGRDFRHAPRRAGGRLERCDAGELLLRFENR